MWSKLQYAYSISVLFGVLVTAFLMMSQDNQSLLPGRGLKSPTYREAQTMDPALSQLMEMENALARVPDSKPETATKKAQKPRSVRVE